MHMHKSDIVASNQMGHGRESTVLHICTQCVRAKKVGNVIS